MKRRRKKEKGINKRLRRSDKVVDDVAGVAVVDDVGDVGGGADVDEAH
jgi:ribose 1,5-bisphosphokinase PhnN